MPRVIEVVPLVHRGARRLALRFPFDPERIAVVRTLPESRWSRTHRCWHIAATEEAYRTLCDRFRGP